MQSKDALSNNSPAEIAAGSKSIGDFLAKHGIKPTRQRIAIATQMYEREQHLSADAILDRVNRDCGTTNVSKATVYNTLKLFVKEGILKEVAIDPQRILFDTNIHPHHHVLNVDNGAIRDIQPININVSDIIEIPDGENVSDVDLIIKVRNSPD